MIRHVPATGCGFQAMLVSKPVLVELEFQASGQGVRSRWEAPRLLDGGVVLQVLWEVRLPWNLELVGVPRGWSDENQWYWDGYVWKQRPWRNVSSLNEWILGSTTIAHGDRRIRRGESRRLASLLVQPFRTTGRLERLGRLPALAGLDLLGSDLAHRFFHHLFQDSVSNDLARYRPRSACWRPSCSRGA